VYKRQGKRSVPTEVNKEIYGKTLPPDDVTNFSINIIGSQAHLTWNPVSALDLSHYRIRHSSRTTGATYSNAVDLLTKVPRPAVFAIAPAMTGTYFIKAIDKTGNESVNATEIVAIIEDIKGLNVVETITENPSFLGVKVECDLNEDGYLILDTASDFDDVLGLFDDVEGYFDGGGGTVSTEGTYYFNDVIDLSLVYTSRVTAKVFAERLDYINLFDDPTILFDERTGLFDGDTSTYGDTDVQLYVSVTEDNPAAIDAVWTDYRKFFVGDYKARAFKFKAILSTSSGSSSPILKELSVSIDMPDRTFGENDLVSGAGAKTVTYSPAFKATPAVGIMAQNLQQGDYYVVSSKTATGFIITFKNSSGTNVSRTFDYVAKGYGELAA
jgi:hypothetical protein